MSDTSSLSDLARFIGQSDLNAADAGTRQRTVNAIASHLMPRRRNVSELLGAVLALSARTRRMVLPRVAIDRIKTRGLVESPCIRMRSPSRAPPEYGLDGSTAMIPTRCPASR